MAIHSICNVHSTSAEMYIAPYMTLDTLLALKTQLFWQVNCDSLYMYVFCVHRLSKVWQPFVWVGLVSLKGECLERRLIVCLHTSLANQPALDGFQLRISLDHSSSRGGSAARLAMLSFGSPAPKAN